MDARSLVLHGEPDVDVLLGPGRLSAELREGMGGEAHADGPSARHGLAAVDQQVQKNLVEHAAIGEDGGHVRGDRDVETDPIAENAAEEIP